MMKHLSENNDLPIEVLQTEEAGRLITFDLPALTHFQEDRPYTQILSDIGTARVVLFAFRAGQQLKEHKTSSQILVHVLEGQITFATASNSVEVHEGMIIQLEANLEHSLIAKTDAVVLLTLTPSPAQHSLQKELWQDQAPLVKRIAKQKR